jgi:cyclic pyranopterin phosphate synthase
MPLVDTFGRLHDNLRISVTDRCNIRCYYCMPETVQFGPKEDILSFEEVTRFTRVAAGLGVRKVRVTGGEPLVRKHLPLLLEQLAAIEGIEDLSLTTNGVLLAGQAKDLYAAGLRRLNIHLDTLDRGRFEVISRRDEFDRVMAGIDECLRLGFHPIKINAVALKGVNEQDMVPLARFGREKGIEVRYIEFMPLDAQGLWDETKVLKASEIRAMLRMEIGPLSADPDPDPRAPATEFFFADGKGRVGFIASVSEPFCANCNRIRLTADGKLRYCLFAIEELDIRDCLRNGGTDDQLSEIIRANVRAKWPGHEINKQQFVAPPRPMYAIGG